jgi:DNA-directed RNA polymerase specialized sigma24 family protein
VPRDFCAIFRDQLDHLYTLALLLTAEHSSAEQCLLQGLEDCILGKPIFREWARSWTRRAIISRAVRMVSPSSKTTGHPAGAKTQQPPGLESDEGSLVRAITELAPLERFVYVMSLLEGYSSDDCSRMLHCTLAEVVDARTSALQQLAGSLNRSPDGFVSAACHV